ncbi:MAG: hypothetical protein WC208_00090 [Gallionella sp.]|jgi:hypothetical protein
MYEGFFLAVLVTLVILAIRPGNKVIYDNPVVIYKPGVYHATLAPSLDRSKNFIEQITSLFLEAGWQAGDIATQYFEVRDVAGNYLLAVGFRGGILYFQAILPSAADSHYNVLHQFSDQVMVHIPLVVFEDTLAGEQLRTAVEAAAKRLAIMCLILQE